MRFIHTADWQIGMKAAHVGEAGEAVRKSRIQCLRKLIDLAGSKQADFILVAGDSFEDNGVDRILVQKVVDTLRDSHVPVYVIPGNHDPLVPGSVWEYPAWKNLDQVYVLSEAAPMTLPGGMLYPCPLFEKRSRKDPTSWIPQCEGEGIRIGLAHGTVEGIPQDEPDYPIAKEAPERAGLDYLALGHWHSTVFYEDSSSHIRMAYSGTHETTKFGERDSGNVLLVEIEEPGAPPNVTPLDTGLLKWVVLENDLREPGDATRLLSEVEEILHSESTLLQIRISGLLPATEHSDLLQLKRLLASRFLHSRLEIGDLRPAPQDEDWVAELPMGVLRETGIRLKELADPSYAGARPQGASPDMASRALLELYAVVTEEGVE